MKSCCSSRAGTILPALALSLTLTVAAHGQDLADAAPEPPLASLVLVLNVISDTHARPATGVVILTAAAGPALVLVPADFVSAGDEIVVLDGGADLLRHGRSTRTVARSAEIGVALLEVEGLERAGVGFSADPWPPAGSGALEFAAWPPAAELAEGAPLVRRSVRPRKASGDGGLATEPALPEVSGPLFDRCGRLAALHFAADEDRLVDAGAVARYLGSAGFDVASAPCAGEPPAAPSGVADESVVPGALPKASPAFSEDQPGAEPPPPADSWPDGTSRRPWALGAVLLAVACVAVILGLRGKPRRFAIRLEGGDDANRGTSLELRFEKPGGVVLLEHKGHALRFQRRGEQLLVSDRGGEDSHRLALALDGTPCLPGEVFIVEPGQEIRLGAETWALRADVEGPGQGVVDP